MISYEDLREEVMMDSLLIMSQINSGTLQLKYSKELANTSKDSIIMTQPVWQADMVNIVNMVNMVQIHLEESYQDMKTWLVKNFEKEEEFMTQF
jgi:hypothetical protein